MTFSNYSPLMDLINGLCYGTKLHIGVLMLGNYGNEKLKVHGDNTMHKGHVCDVLKSYPNGLSKCMRCRQVALSKVMRDKKPFAGFCVNGVYEYTRPLLENDEIFCIIYIGNIYLKNNRPKNLTAELKKYDIPAQEIIATMEPDFTYEKCIKLADMLESYIRILLKESPTSTNGNEYIPIIENIKNYITANLEYNITPEQIAEAFHYNKQYVGRLFKQKTGKSIKEYINYRRLKLANILLTETNDTVLSISMRLGYNNISYFNRIYKQYYGITPGEYRQQFYKYGIEKATGQIPF